jgi:hypothetical protein
MDLLSGSVAADIAKFFEKWQPESEPLCLSRDVPANLRNAGQTDVRRNRKGSAVCRAALS